MRSVITWMLLFAGFISAADPQPEVSFIQNKNQWKTDVLFRSPVESGSLIFYRNKIQLLFQETPQKNVVQDKKVQDGEPTEYGEMLRRSKGHLVQVEFLESNSLVRVNGEGQLITRYNYFLSDDKSTWASDVSAFEKIRYDEMYCGVDMLYYAEGTRLKYDWIVSPQVDPSIIRMEYTGIDNLELHEENLYFKTSVGEVWEMKPIAYQWKNGTKVRVQCRYKLQGKRVQYDFPDGYDECETLVIDPILIFSAYSGSTLDNWGNTATYDSDGNVYSGGMVVNGLTGFPTTVGAFQEDHAGGTWDVGILKYDSSGSQLLYCTYLGGNDTETPQSLVVNKAGELLILGATGSTNFPVTNGSLFRGGPAIDPLGGVYYDRGTDIFVAKLSSDGDQLLGATYLGGTKNDGVNFISGEMNTTVKQESPLARNYGDQLRGDIITDDDNFVYIASNTLSSDFPIVNSSTVFNGGSHDAVVVKLQPDLSSIAWSRFIGGGHTDAAYSIKLDPANRIYVAGGTRSASIAGMNGFKTVNHGDIDGWVMSLLPDGNTLNGTFLGTASYDQCYFVDLDTDGNVFLFGQTRGNYHVSRSQGVYNNPNSGQFIQKLSNNLKDTVYSTVFGTGGNNPNISPTAFQINDCGYLYLSGWGGRTNATQSGIITRNYVGGNTLDLPITPDAYQATTFGNDFYLMVLSADAKEFLYGTFLGGRVTATHVDGGTSRFDKQGIVYHAVCAGCGGVDDDFPAVNVPPLHQKNRSANCNNAVFKFDLSLLKARLQTNSIHFDSPGINVICVPDKVVFQNKSFGGETYEWDLGDGTKITKTDTTMVIHQYMEYDRQYTIWLKAIDQGTCKGKDSVSVVISVYKAEAEVQDDDELCEGVEYTLNASGGAQYEWTDQSGGFESSSPQPKVSPVDTTVYYVKITETNGCVHRDTVQLNVIPGINVDFELEQQTSCLTRPTITLQNTTDSLWSTDQMFFDLGDGSTTDAVTFRHDYESDGLYTVKLIGTREAGEEVCVTEKSEQVHAFTLHVPNVITPVIKDGSNDTFVVAYGDDHGTPGDFGFKVSLVIYNRWGGQVYKSADYKNDWSGEQVAPGIYYYEVEIENHALVCKSWLQVMKP